MIATTASAREAQYKFQKLEVYQQALEYLDRIYDLTKTFPAEEKYNLTSQLQRAATSIALNIAEGSTGQSDAEQHRFLGLSLRSYLETVACLDIALRRRIVTDHDVEGIGALGHQLFAKIQAFRRSLRNQSVSGQ
ncbi:MAG: four helix bundle protein [Pyrinomonadaceae bacterium]